MSNQLVVVYEDIDKLQPYENNTRLHSEDQVKQIAASISEFGFTNPILIDENFEVIAGHGRLLASQSLGIEEVPTIMLRGLTDAQKKAYSIADNKLHDNSSWDMELLSAEVESLRELDFDVSLLGFDDIGLLSIDTEAPDEFLFDVGEVSFDELDNEPKKEEPTKTSDGFTEFALVMTVENKQELVAAINHARKEHDCINQEQALMEIVRRYG